MTSMIAGGTIIGMKRLNEPPSATGPGRVTERVLKTPRKRPQGCA